jgi:hypothetical protein
MNLKIGILVVGSLDWESKDYGGACRDELANHGGSLNSSRKRWRERRLIDAAESEFMVRVPIRYGRLSGSRGNTFTMVFSPEYEQRLGTAKIIQCKKPVSGFGDLLQEAVELWVAESGEKHRGKLSASWGCITLLAPGDFLDHPDRNERQHLLDAWAAKVSEQKPYGKLGFSIGDTDAAKGAVIAAGRLRIAWPTLTSGGPAPFDLLLATATNPMITSGQERAGYPSVKEIADAWNKGGHVYYFRCNRLTGIHTFDDGAIENLLKC